MVSKTRKAPTASATLFKRGTIKTGNDGNKWSIVADTRVEFNDGRKSTQQHVKTGR